MKDLFITWITIQLMVLWIASLSIENDINKWTYECRKSTWDMPLINWALFPLFYFTSDNVIEKVNKYCEK